MDLIIASSNQGKVNEIKAILGGYFNNILSMKEIGLELDIVEDGSTFLENALIKAQAVLGATGKWSLADDSGLAVDALQGAPGVFSARYAGENATDEQNNQKLLTALRGVAEADREHLFNAVWRWQGQCRISL